jgi:DNA helicase II / ATP-dependent DNA helicase PcrA
MFSQVHPSDSDATRASASAFGAPATTLGAQMPILAHLNPEQYAAVTLPTGHALVLAGAGSGKTRVLTTRIAWLLQTGQASPSGILAVTFTNKAAKEMLTRLGAMIPVSLRGMWIGTFHGLCHRFLRTHHQAANLPQSFQILDTQDQLSAVKRLCKQFNVDDERFPPKQLAWFFSACKEEGHRPGDVIARDPDTRKKVELYALYEEQCQREGVVDFGELMLRSYELLRDDKALREHYQRRFRYLLIDEFQDTNRLQYAWIKLLAGKVEPLMRSENPPPEGAVMAVGDDDQSIYAFRGARVGNMADFLKEFGVVQQIKLEENYRSYSNILDSANALISHNRTRLGKNLRTAQGPGEPVRVLEMGSDFQEAQWLVEEIAQLTQPSPGQAPLHKQEVAILYRSNAQSRVIETGLFNAGIAYRVYGGLRFFERAEIKHAMAYLRLLENPRDDTSFLRVVNFPPRGIGARSLEQLQDLAHGAGCALSDAVSAMTGKAGANLSGFMGKIEVMREATVGLTLREIVALVLRHSGLIEHYRLEKEGADRVENLEELLNAAESFVSLEGFGRNAVALPESGVAVGAPSFDQLNVLLNEASNQSTYEGADQAMAAPNGDELTGETMSPLAAFLSHASLEAGDNQAQAGQDAVQLMTVHAAKGLEFDAVFITGLEEGLFPHENSITDVGGLEEERRLMYVAITRARKRLYLSFCQTRMLHGQTRYNMRSRFLEELPETALKWITPRNPGFDATSGGGKSYGGGYGQSGYVGGYPNHSGSAWAKQKAPWIAQNAAGTARDIPRDALARNVSATSETDAAFQLKAGMAVFHNKFGEGTVLTLEGSGTDGRAQINFKRHGVKWLALSVAKLTPV